MSNKVLVQKYVFLYYCKSGITARMKIQFMLANRAECSAPNFGRIHKMLEMENKIMGDISSQMLFGVSVCLKCRNLADKRDLVC